MKRFEIMEKFYSSKTLLKIAGGGMHTQHILHPPGSIRPWLYNSKKWPQIYERCFKLKIPKAVKTQLLQGSQRNAFWWNR